MDNPGFESSEPNATKGGQEQEQEQEQEQKVEDSVEDIQRDKDQDSVNVPVQHVSITFRQDVEKGGEGEEGEDHLYPSLEEEEDPDMLKKKESGSALSKALKSSPYNEKSHLTKSEARLAGTKANDKV